MDEELDFSRFKYVLYARKSTDDPQRQVRSIGDQIFPDFYHQEHSSLKLKVFEALKV